MLMMEPPPDSIMRGITALAASTMVFRLTFITRSQSASLTSTTVPRCEMPDVVVEDVDAPVPLNGGLRHALRSRPGWSCLPGTTDASPPSDLMISRVSLARSSTWSTSRTLAPSPGHQNRRRLAVADTLAAGSGTGNDRHLALKPGHPFRHGINSPVRLQKIALRPPFHGKPLHKAYNRGKRGSLSSANDVDWAAI